jgi:hypothetical protein
MALQLEFEGRWTGKQSAQSTPVDDQIATFEDVTITLRVPHEQFEFETAHSGNRRLVSGREFAELEVASEEPLSLDALDKLAKALQDLITFAAVAPAGVLRRTAFAQPTADGRPARVRGIELLGRQVYEPGSAVEPQKRHHDYLFTLEQVDFAEIIPAWLAFHRQAWLPCSMLFGTKYSRAGFTPVRFLTIASAAEGLHRTLHDREPLDAAVFEQACATILRSVGGAENKAVRALIREQLHNTLSYRQRLFELASLPDSAVVAELLPDIEAWVKLTKDTRNGVAHADDTRPGSRPDGVVIFWLTEITYYLVSLAILADLGIDVETQQRAVNLPKVTFARREFRELTQRLKLELKS